MSANNQIVRIVAPTQHIANAIALCVASVVKLIEQATAVKTPVPAAAMATVAMDTATYNVATPASSDVAVPDLSTAPRYAAQQPFEGQGENLGSGYFAEQVEDGYNIWFGTGALAPDGEGPRPGDRPPGRRRHPRQGTRQDGRRPLRARRCLQASRWLRRSTA